MQAHQSLSIKQRQMFEVKMRRSAKHVPKHTVLSSFEPESMGGTTLFMTDYAVLLTVRPTVFQYGVHTQPTCAHVATTLQRL